jgi:uncharacterized protein YbaA (DUF1428 family)
MAKKAAKVWLEHGALQFVESAGDDLETRGMVPFTKAASTKTGEVPVFSFIVYRNKAHRDRVNAKVMKDPRIAAMTKGKKMPFDCRRMAYGGFRVIVEA